MKHVASGSQNSFCILARLSGEYLITNFKFKLGDKATHSAVFLVVLESASQVFQATFSHTCQTDKDLICNVGPDAMYESRISWKKIHNTQYYALR